VAAPGSLRPRAIIDDARRLRRAGGDPLEQSDQAREKARTAFETVRDQLVRQQLESIPLTRLRETTEGRVRFNAIERAGYRTVASVLDAGPSKLYRISGVGEHSAMQVVAAARQLERALAENSQVRIDVEKKPKPHAALLKALSAYGVLEAALAPVEDDLRGLVTYLDDTVERARRTTSRLRMTFCRAPTRAAAREALDELHAFMQSPEAHSWGERLDQVAHEIATSPKSSGKAPWTEFEKGAARFNGLLIKVGGQTPDENASQGFVPDEIARAVHEHPLDTSLLKVPLRGYQQFGAKFALTQQKAILGDEMGLGKTIEALSAICHLAANGATHFLVVSPASVLVNWIHETERHSELKAFRLHGPERDLNLKLWARRGGVGMTTFDSLKTLGKPDGVKIAILIVDEAHYVKNPNAQRTQAVVRWIRQADRTLLLTGTPMENRIEEFRNLVQHIQPKVAAQVDAIHGFIGAARFRSTVAPVYLRRNQADVLPELPDKIENEEWVAFEGEDLSTYRDAVTSGNFMAMRQAAYAPANPTGSAKLSRLKDIVFESAENDRKIVVFSYFRSVLETVAHELGELALPPITGSVTPSTRQSLVDDFSTRTGPAVLVSQIEAGGVGLNIQAASVVILTEPQWKPSTENQAIARLHRLGQARTVNVHRMLAENSVDQRMLEVLAGKTALFDEYVRRSDLKDATPDAVDVSNLEATKGSATQAENERRIIELERLRLGIEPEPTAVAASEPDGHRTSST
jgi:superfamily II DNA or RNA helicase